MVWEQEGGLQTFKWVNKGPFPLDFAFEAELPRLRTCRHFLHIGFELSSGFLIK